MILAYIDIVIVLHCLIFGFFFLFRKGGVGRSNSFLAVLLFLLTLISLPFALKPTGWIFDFPYLIDTEWPAAFLFAPFYLWYVREMTGEKIHFTTKEYIQLIPALLAFLYFSKFHFKNPEEQLAYLKLIQFTYIQDYQIGDALFYPYIQGYLIYVIVLLNKRKKKISDLFLNNLNWLKKYTVLLLSFGFFGAAVYLLNLPQVYINAIPLASSAIYLTLIYRFLQQSGQPVAEIVKEDKKEQKPKYAGSNLSMEEAEKLNREIQNILKQEKPFLKADLTLQHLAQLVPTTPHYLSQVINQFHQKNFSDFINAFRIQEAQQRIIENNGLPFEKIGYECGFKAKTTFNAAFKKIAGCTPSEFKKNRTEQN